MDVILTGMKSDVGGGEGEMIWIWSGVDGVSSWHGLGGVDETGGVANEVSWISAWMPTTVVVPMVDWTGPEGMDPSVLVEVDRLVDVEELDELSMVQEVRWPVESEVVDWLVAGSEAVSGSSRGRNAGFLW